ncbi:MAG: phytoene desaturase family protein [Patescibacteria group bacterium]
MRCIVIGAGIAGLATAALLAKDGHQVTVLEKNANIGGRARTFQQDGFTFDMGPSWYHMPEAFEHFFALFGKSIPDVYQLEKLDPQYRVFFPDTKEITVYPDGLKNYHLFEELDPGSAKRVDTFLAEARKQYELSRDLVLYRNFTKATDFFNPELLVKGRHFTILRTMEQEVKRVTSNRYLQRLLMFTVLFLGGSPNKTPGMFSMMTYLDLGVGAYYPQGGIGTVILALEKLCHEHGVTIQTDTEVTACSFASSSTKSNGSAQTGSPAITQVTTVNGQTYQPDIVVSNADYPFFETEVLPIEHQTYPDNYWEKKTLAPSSFILYLGVQGKLKKACHHTLFLEFEWDQFFDEVFQGDSFPTSPSFYMSCISKTDPNMAPKGDENVFVTVQCSPYVNDTDQVREEYARYIINRIEERLGEKFANRIVMQRIFSPRDFKQDYHAYKGTAIGLANILTQSAYFRPQNRSKKLANLYYTGQYTHPGVGMPMTLISAELVAQRIDEDLAQR